MTLQQIIDYFFKQAQSNKRADKIKHFLDILDRRATLQRTRLEILGEGVTELITDYEFNVTAMQGFFFK